ncbi:MAG: hypothetical protein IJ565_03665 [Bacilli bacterium]|nr:hypothetical protein [Bacilli bacterium]
MNQKTVKSKYTVDDIPVRAINNGVILLTNGMKVTGVKIMPKNIFILDQGTQNAIIDNLRNVYNMIDYEFWTIAADRPVDINLYLSQLQVLYNSTQAPSKRKLIMEDINKANMFMNNNVVDTEYFILFKEKNDETIQKRVRNLINYLAGASLSATQVSNDDLRMILDNFLNGGQTTKFGTVMS